MMVSMKGCFASKAMWVLLLVGALNWGLVGIGGFFGNDWNLVLLLFGGWAWLENFIYLLVGLSGAMMLMGGCKCVTCKAYCCKKESCEVKTDTTT